MHRLVFSHWAVLVILVFPAASVEVIAEDPVAAAPPVIHVATGVEPGEAIGDIRDLLDVASDDAIELKQPLDAGFAIDTEGILSLRNAPAGASEDVEYVLEFEISRPLSADSLRDRFVSIVKERGAADDRTDPFERQRRTAEVRVIVEAPKPPQLLADPLWTRTPANIAPGDTVGRVVAVPADQRGPLQYRLLNPESLVRIDSETGTLSIRDQVSLPAVGALTAQVEVVDAAGLTDVRTYQVRLNRAGTITTQPGKVAANGTDTPAVSHPPVQSSPTVESQLPVIDKPPVVAVTPSAEVNTPTLAQETPKPAAAEVPPLSTVKPPKTESTAAASAALNEETAQTDAMMTIGFPLLALAAVGLLYWRRRSSAGQQMADITHVETSETQHAAGNTEQRPSIPAELDAVLSKLGGSLNADGDAESEEYATANQEGAAAAAVHTQDWMRDVLGAAGLLASGENAGQLKVATQPGVDGEEPSVDFSSDVSELTSPLQRRESDGLSKSERDRMEEFRQISRTSSRAKIQLHHRKRMKSDWMASGAIAAACMLTGLAFIFTRCVGEVSVPCGSVLLLVSAILLTRRSLYPQLPRRRATD